MRNIIMAVALACLMTGTATARDRHVAPHAPTLAERLDALGAGSVVETTEADWIASMGRNTLDVRFGPADGGDGSYVVWHADSEARDSSMRRAGIARITIVRRDGVVRLTADAQLMTLASR